MPFTENDTHANTINQQVQAIGEQAQNYMSQQLKSTGKDDLLKDLKTLVFVSWGMPDKELKPIFEQAALRQDVTLFFNGFGPDGLKGFMKRYARLSYGEDVDWTDPKTANIPIPAALIDPNMFTGYRIKSVPVFLSRTSSGWRRVTGSTSIALAEETIARGRYNIKVGNVFNVAEESALVEFERAAAAFAGNENNYKELKARAVRSADHWLKASTVRLPNTPGTKSIEYFTDPSIVANRDIKNDKGEIVVLKGTHINPLNYIQMAPMIIFDPSDADQMQWANQTYSKYRDKNPVVFATSISDASTALLVNKLFDDHANPLMPIWQERLGVKYSPSLIIQQDDKLKIMSVPMVKTDGLTRSNSNTTLQ